MKETGHVTAVGQTGCNFPVLFSRGCVSAPRAKWLLLHPSSQQRVGFTGKCGDWVFLTGEHLGTASALMEEISERRYHFEGARDGAGVALTCLTATKSLGQVH